MKEIIADGNHYFGRSGFPLAVWRVRTDMRHSDSHPHDLTEIEHSHDFHELVVVSAGTAMHRLEGSVFPVAAGDVFLLQGHQSHYFYDRDRLDLINIMYDPAKIGLPESDLRRMPGYCAMFMLEPNYRYRHDFASRLHLERSTLARIEQLAEEMEAEFRAGKPGYEAAMRAKLVELIVFLSREYMQSNNLQAGDLLRIGNVIGAIEEGYSRQWQLDDFLRIANMSRSNLMRVFRRATGQTPIDYLIRLRIQRSMELLRHSELSVTEVAMEVGFSDSNYFARQFRKTQKQSPSAYRKSQLAHGI